MKKRVTQHHLDGLIALLLFGLFAVCILAVLLTGAKAYRRLTQRDQAAYERRTSVQYIATRVRQADRLGGVTLEPFGDGLALVLPDGEGFVTRVYWDGGYIKELYTAIDAELSPPDGENILKSGGLELSLEDGLLTVTSTTPDGARDTLRLSLRSGEEAA